MILGELGPVHACCGSWPEHRYRCQNRTWPATATPEIRRQAVRGDCIAPAHARIEDLGVRGLDYQQRKRLTEILAQVWDDGFGYGRGHDCSTVGNVIYCCGCQRIWVDRSVSIVALAGGIVPADCACACTDDTDPLYETWIVNPDEDDLPEGVWVS